MGFARRLPASARLAAPPLAGDKPQRYWKQLFSYQSFMPAAAGTPRYENWVHWLMEGFRCRLCPPPHPWLGTSPSPTFLFRPGAVVVRATVVGVAGRQPLPAARHWLGTSPRPTFLCSDSRRAPAIPDQSPGHAFAPTTLTRLVHIGLNSYDRCDCLTGGGAVITLRTVLRFPNLDTGEASRTNHEWPILRKNSTNQAKLLRR